MNEMKLSNLVWIFFFFLDVIFIEFQPMMSASDNCALYHQTKIIISFFFLCVCVCVCIGRDGR